MTGLSDEGLCHYCGLRPAGSDEHLPGSVALNDSPVTITYLKFVGGKMDSVTRHEEGGFVVHTLCRKCNSRSGGNYGTAFKHFARQFADSGKFFTPDLKRALISLTDFEPLRVLKQMAGMVLAVQAEQPIPALLPLQPFVLRKHTRLPRNGGHFYLYRNVSGTGRVASIFALTSLRSQGQWPPLLFTEISWPPMGLIHAVNPHPLLHGLTDISDWGRRYHFRSKERLNFSVPQKRVEVNFPGAFGSQREHHEWMDREMIVAALRTGTEGDLPTQISALVERHRRKL